MTAEEKRIFWIVAAIGLVSCLFYGGKLMAEPIKLNPFWCAEYANDGHKASRMKMEGKTKEQTIAAFEEHRGDYPPRMWAHVLSLIDRAYAYNLGSDEFRKSIYLDCKKHDGWVDREA